MKNESEMYGGLFDFNQDGKLNILEKSAEMDYFANQVENVQLRLSRFLVKSKCFLKLQRTVILIVMKYGCGMR